MFGEPTDINHQDLRKGNFNHNISFILVRCLSTSTSVCSAEENKDYKVNPVFLNRNPRNLEYMNLAYKRRGWRFQAPRKDYYNKLIFEPGNSQTKAYIEHWQGTRVVEASTKEWAIRKHLYSCTDVSAAKAVGSVLARRCLESGLTCVFYDEQPEDKNSEKYQSFLTAIKEGHVELTEPEEIVPEYKPGIDYEKPNRLAEKKIYKDDYQLA
ncbi:hypothetical protein ACJMK2_012525 [Sinanodonta woodiana]|uniref:Large ribosomal subunit protein uL18m n=1 Tax=Sinanodonta woodiana TaxID=1069815 RepID=A0ABD3V8I4_SINWO